MTQSRRRLVLQLTPLLDLLLIVIFAQYMELQQAADRQAQETVQAKSQSAEAMQAARQAEDAAVRLQTSLTAEQRASRELRQDLVTQFAELWHIPPEMIEQGLSTQDVKDRQELRRRATEMSGGEATAIVQRLAALAELRRVSEMWVVHIDDDNIVRVQAGEQSTFFRSESAQEFEHRLLDWARTLPPPKSLVLLQLTWGDATSGARVDAKQGLVKAVEQLRQERPGRTVYEFVVLGFRPDGPMSGTFNQRP